MPLVKAETLRSFIDTFLGNDSTIAVLTAVVKDPYGYGRIIRGPEGWLERIVEEKDASDEESLIREINTGIFCVRSAFLMEGLKEIGKENVQGEYYLTDLVEVARKRDLRCSAHMVADPVEVMGINTRVDLATATEALRQEKVKELMLSGVTIIDPRTTYLDRTVEIGKDTTLYPNCTLQGRTRIGERCVIETELKDFRYRNRRWSYNPFLLCHHRKQDRGWGHHRALCPPETTERSEGEGKDRKLRRGEEIGHR